MIPQVILAIAVLAAAATSARADKAELARMREACELAEPTCDPVALLSPLERRAVHRALAARGLELDHAPYGKQVGRIHIVAQPVFGVGDGFLTWMNHFHRTTREKAVRHELVVRTGVPWDQRRVDESARRLRDPTSTSLAALVPVKSDVEGEVDVLVVTRDVWSLRMNSSFEVQANQISGVSVALSENNFLGLRKLLALSFRMDQGAYSIGPLYIDKNLAGRHLDLRGRGGPVFNRHTSELEGSESILELARPLWSLDTTWGAGIELSHKLGIDRSFEGNELRRYDAPSTPEDDEAPYAYRQRKLSLAASVVRGFGDDRLQQRIRGGYQLAVQRPALLEDFPENPLLRADFTAEVLPRSERTSLLYAGWELFTPRYRNFQNMGTFELAEDTRMGPELTATIGAARRLYGSQFNFVRASGAASYTGALGDDGLWLARVAASTRIEGGRTIDNLVETRLRVVTPTFPIGRVMSEVRLSGLYRDSQNQFFTLGGDNGLRAFPIGGFVGDRRAVWVTELRSRPFPILFARFGLVAFYEIGGAAESVETMELHHDVGLGLRSLIPQMNPDPFRIDLAFPLQGGMEVRGLRISAGYDQVF